MIEKVRSIAIGSPYREDQQTDRLIESSAMRGKEAPIARSVQQHDPGGHRSVRRASWRTRQDERHFILPEDLRVLDGGEIRPSIAGGDQLSVTGTNRAALAFCVRAT
jgi:hypothetical protein